MAEFSDYMYSLIDSEDLTFNEAVHEAFNIFKIPRNVYVFGMKNVEEFERQNGICLKIKDDIIIIGIKIHNRPFHEILVTLMHEIAHAKDFISGKLDHGETPEIVIFDGIVYDKTTIDYLDMPWEIEARKQEVILIEEFLEKSSRKVYKKFRKSKRNDIIKGFFYTFFPALQSKS